MDEPAVWSHAVTILDESEIAVRDAIERGFAPVARLPHVRIKDAEDVTQKVMREVGELRIAAFKKAFRFVRSQRGDLPIMDISLAKWAHRLAKMDVEAINSTVRAGLAGGLSNTAIARRVIGSLSKNGADGATQFTRHRIVHLARSSIRAQKDG